MRQRFGIAVALLGDPSLIIVDEPTAGLDPAERVRFLNLLSEIGENSVVILSTHIVEDVAELCPRMAIIDKGEILLEAEPLAAIAALRGRVWKRIVTKQELPAIERDHRLVCTKLQAGRTLVHVYADTRPGAGVRAGRGGPGGRLLQRHGGPSRRARGEGAPHARAGGRVVTDDVSSRGTGAGALGEVFRFEVGYRLRQASTWIYAAVLLGVPFLLVHAINGSRQFLNAPVMVMYQSGLLGGVGLLVSAGIFGDAAARDVQSRMYALFYTSPLRERHYVVGRFLGAAAVNAVLLLGIPLGLLVASVMPYMPRGSSAPCSSPRTCRRTP